MRCLWIIFAIAVFAVPARIALADTLIERVSGYILLDVEASGEAWYVNPVTDKRHYLGRPTDAFSIMRYLSLGITNSELAKIPTSEESEPGDLTLRSRLSGRILLQVEGHGEAWYVYPKDLKRYYLGRPDDAFRIMSSLGLGISSADLANVPVAPPIVPQVSSYQSYKLTIAQGSFNIRLVTMNKNAFAMISDTAQTENCSNNCDAKPLAEYVAENGGEVGINGTYFCPPDYADCQNKINQFFWPVYNSVAEVMINEKSLAVHHGPLVAYTADGDYLYYHRAADFGDSVEEFEERTSERLLSAIANYPSLLEDGEIVVFSEQMLDEGQRTIKGTRNGIGFDGDQFFLVSASSATVPDLAYIFKALGAKNAMNLDGGGSTALYYGGGYKLGPGRELPNALVFVRR